MRRSKIGKSYVRRRSDGTFSKWTNIGSSLRADRRNKAYCVKKGYGHRGDTQNCKVKYSMKPKNSVKDMKCPKMSYKKMLNN